MAGRSRQGLLFAAAGVCCLLGFSVTWGRRPASIESVAGGAHLVRLPARCRPDVMCWSPDGAELAVGVRGGRILVLEQEGTQPQEIEVVTGFGCVYFRDIAWHPAGRKLAAVYRATDSPNERSPWHVAIVSLQPPSVRLLAQDISAVGWGKTLVGLPWARGRETYVWVALEGSPTKATVPAGLDRAAISQHAEAIVAALLASETSADSDEGYPVLRIIRLLATRRGLDILWERDLRGGPAEPMPIRVEWSARHDAAVVSWPQATDGLSSWGHAVVAKYGQFEYTPDKVETPEFVEFTHHPTPACWCGRYLLSVDERLRRPVEGLTETVATEAVLVEAWGRKRAVFPLPGRAWGGWPVAGSASKAAITVCLPGEGEDVTYGIAIIRPPSGGERTGQ